MTPAEFVIQFGWLIALTVAVGVISWVVLLLQALFHDKRIALVGVFASLLFSFTFLFPQVIPFTIKYTATVLCGVFLLWFSWLHFKKVYVWLPVTGIVLSGACAYWLYQMYQTAGTV